ncbi:MAG: hypothetical protein WCB70_17020 [Xanthobacteraceae bacterium]
MASPAPRTTSGIERISHYIQTSRRNVRFGSKADIASIKRDVRYTPESGIDRHLLDVCFGPEADIRQMFDYMVGAREWRNLAADRWPF